MRIEIDLTDSLSEITKQKQKIDRSRQKIFKHLKQNQAKWKAYQQLLALRQAIQTEFEPFKDEATPGYYLVDRSGAIDKFVGAYLHGAVRKTGKNTKGAKQYAEMLAKIRTGILEIKAEIEQERSTAVLLTEDFKESPACVALTGQEIVSEFPQEIEESTKKYAEALKGYAYKLEGNLTFVNTDIRQLENFGGKIAEECKALTDLWNQCVQALGSALKAYNEFDVHRERCIKEEKEKNERRKKDLEKVTAKALKNRDRKELQQALEGLKKGLDAVMTEIMKGTGSIPKCISYLQTFLSTIRDEGRIERKEYDFSIRDKEITHDELKTLARNTFFIRKIDDKTVESTFLTFSGKILKHNFATKAGTFKVFNEKSLKPLLPEIFKDFEKDGIFFGINLNWQEIFDELCKKAGHALISVNLLQLVSDEQKALIEGSTLTSSGVDSVDTNKSFREISRQQSGVAAANLDEKSGSEEEKRKKREDFIKQKARGKIALAYGSAFIGKVVVMLRIFRKNIRNTLDTKNSSSLIYWLDQLIQKLMIVKGEAEEVERQINAQIEKYRDMLLKMQTPEMGKNKEKLEKLEEFIEFSKNIFTNKPTDNSSVLAPSSLKKREFVSSQEVESSILTYQDQLLFRLEKNANRLDIIGLLNAITSQSTLTEQIEKIIKGIQEAHHSDQEEKKSESSLKNFPPLISFLSWEEILTEKVKDFKPFSGKFSEEHEQLKQEILKMEEYFIQWLNEDFCRPAISRLILEKVAMLVRQIEQVEENWKELEENNAPGKIPAILKAWVEGDEKKAMQGSSMMTPIDKIVNKIDQFTTMDWRKKPLITQELARYSTELKDFKNFSLTEDLLREKLLNQRGKVYEHIISLLSDRYSKSKEGQEAKNRPEIIKCCDQLNSQFNSFFNKTKNKEISSQDAELLINILRKISELGNALFKIISFDMRSGFYHELTNIKSFVDSIPVKLRNVQGKMKDFKGKKQEEKMSTEFFITDSDRQYFSQNVSKNLETLRSSHHEMPSKPHCLQKLADLMPQLLTQQKDELKPLDLSGQKEYGIFLTGLYLDRERAGLLAATAGVQKFSIEILYLIHQLGGNVKAEAPIYKSLLNCKDKTFMEKRNILIELLADQTYRLATAINNKCDIELQLQIDKESATFTVISLIGMAEQYDAACSSMNKVLLPSHKTAFEKEKLAPKRESIKTGLGQMAEALDIKITKGKNYSEQARELEAGIKQKFPVSPEAPSTRKLPLDEPTEEEKIVVIQDGKNTLSVSPELKAPQAIDQVAQLLKLSVVAVEDKSPVASKIAEDSSPKKRTVVSKPTPPAPAPELEPAPEPALVPASELTPIPASTPAPVAETPIIPALLTSPSSTTTTTTTTAVTTTPTSPQTPAPEVEQKKEPLDSKAIQEKSKAIVQGLLTLKGEAEKAEIQKLILGEFEIFLAVWFDLSVEETHRKVWKEYVPFIVAGNTHVLTAEKMKDINFLMLRDSIVIPDSFSSSQKEGKNAGFLKLQVGENRSMYQSLLVAARMINEFEVTKAMKAFIKKIEKLEKEVEEDRQSHPDLLDVEKWKSWKNRKVQNDFLKFYSKVLKSNIVIYNEEKSKIKMIKSEEKENTIYLYEDKNKNYSPLIPVTYLTTEKNLKELRIVHEAVIRNTDLNPSVKPGNGASSALIKLTVTRLSKGDTRASAAAFHF
jgi:hypothetical protein